MKKTTTFAQRSLIAGAALATLAGAAHAQSVTLFGRLDAGIQYVSKTPGGDEGSLTTLHNGGILPSIWGMRGEEDLGGGLKAVFNLESDFDSSTGGSRGLGSISTLFGRQANVGLAGDWGKVLLGRQYSPALLAELGTEPRGYKESLSGLLSYAFTQVPAGNDVGPNNGAGIFTSNMVSYSGTFGPIGVGVGYGLGEGGAGGLGDGRTVSLGASYTGPVVVSLTYQKIEGSPDAESQRVGVGVAVPFGAFTVKALYAKSTTDFTDGEEIDDVDNFGIGADFRWHPSNTATIAYYYGKDDEDEDNKTKSLVVSNDYALSKRTVLYAQYAFIDADDGSSLNTQISAGATPAGEKAHILGVGLMHNF